MIAIVDYGMGNLRSVQKAFEYLGVDARIGSDRALLADASHIVLPGVGAFADAAEALRRAGLDEELKRQIASGKPFLGICLGMQLLFDRSFEDGEHEGLSLVPGEAVRFDVKGLKVPHIGWNTVRVVKETPLFKGAKDLCFYFVHSYHAASVAPDCVETVCEYGCEFVSSVNRGNVFGVQFHPEKSGEAGLELLKNFGGMA